MTCFDCVYYIEPGPGKFLCRRYPPQYLGHTIYFENGQQKLQMISDFAPINRPQISCGEWVAKNEPV